MIKGIRVAIVVIITLILCIMVVYFSIKTKDVEYLLLAFMCIPISITTINIILNGSDDDA